MNHQKTKIVDRQIIFDDIFRLEKDTLVNANQAEQDYSYVTLKPAVAVLAQKKDSDQWILVKEFRYPIKSIVYGLPGGIIEAGESTLEAAHRELAEETGYQGESASLLGSFFPLPGVANFTIQIVVIEKAVLTQKMNHDPFEQIEPILLTNQEIRVLQKQNAPFDGILCAALHWWESQ